MVIGVATRTVNRWMAERRVPFMRLGPGTIRFEQSALERYIRRHEERPL